MTRRSLWKAPLGGGSIRSSVVLINAMFNLRLLWTGRAHQRLNKGKRGEIAWDMSLRVRQKGSSPHMHALPTNLITDGHVAGQHGLFLGQRVQISSN